MFASAMPGRQAILALMSVTAICLSTAAIASDPGMAAADQVSQVSYIDYLDNWLYTHTGDDRGFGPEHDLARDNIEDLFLAYGLTVTLEPFEYSGNTYYNVVATKLGTTFPDQEYIIGGHYDSVGNPGADDNASGVAAVLEAARILSQYDSAYTIRFIAFDREEQGLIGSYAYVADHAGDDILGMISTDMVAYNTGANLGQIRAGSGSTGIANALAAAVTEYGDGLDYVLGGPSGGSDHAPFEQAGYEACLLIEDWGNPYYHTQQDCFDTPNYLDFPFAVRMTRSVVGWMVDAAGILVEYDGLGFEYPDGRPQYVAPSGGTTMRVEVVGVGTVAPQPGTGMLHYDVGAGWESVAMIEVSPNVYDAVFPPADCGSEVLYYVSAVGDDGETYYSPTNAPTQFHSTLAAYGETVFYENTFDTDPGWTTEDLWAFGQPTCGGGQYGYPDPTSGFTGPYVYGYNLTGDYQNNLPERHLTSDAIDCSGMFDVSLRFQRWLGVEQPVYDHAYIRVSNNGSTWVTVWENTSEVTDADWQAVECDISAVADDQPTVYLRWTMGTTDGGWRYCGWNIDDVQLVALDCDSPCPPDVNGDGVVDVLDLLLVLAAWGAAGGPEDINGDGIVDVLDLLEILAAWGPC